MSDKLASIKSFEVRERDAAYNCIIRASQQSLFPVEYDNLIKGLPISARNRLLLCDVFLNSQGIIRSRGRTFHAAFSYDTKFPVISSVKSRFLELFIEYVHSSFFHANKSFLLNYFQSEFWIIGNFISLIKKILRKYVFCIRLRAQCQRQLMSDLPKERVSISRPFSNVGVDLTGAIEIKCTNHRTYKHYKVYLSFFVYFATRAVHIEIVEDLTIEAILNVLERFIGR